MLSKSVVTMAGIVAWSAPGTVTQYWPWLVRTTDATFLTRSGEHVAGRGPVHVSGSTRA